MINREKLIACSGHGTDEQFRNSHRQWVEESIHRGSNVRQPEWTESIAVGSEGFVHGILKKLRRHVKGCKVKTAVDDYELREPGVTYDVLFSPEKGLLTVDNEFFWNRL